MVPSTADHTIKPDAAMKSLRKLEEFEATLSYGKDLFHSTYSLLSYSFGSQSIQDVCSSALSYPAYQGKCRSIAKNLCIAAISALDPLFNKERNIKDNVFLTEQAKLLWEVYQLKFIPGLLQTEEISLLDEMLGKIALHFSESDIEQKLRNLFPAEFLRLLEKEQDPSAAQEHAVKRLPYFLRDLTFSNRSSADIVACESASINDDLIRRIGGVLDSFVVGNADNVAMQEVSEVVADKGISMDDVDKFVKITARIVSVMDSILSCSPSAVAAFFAMFENLLCSLPEAVKDAVMKQFYEAWLTKYGGLPSLGEHLTNIDIDVTESVNGLGDHVDIQNNFPKFKKVRDKLSFYLLVNPLPTLNRLLIQALDNKLIVPGLLNILRHCSTLFEQKVKSSKVSLQPISVLLSCIITVFEVEAHRWTSVEQQDRLVYLLSSLCRRKRSDAKEKTSKDCFERTHSTASEYPILNANELIRLFILPNLMKRSQEVLMLKLLHRLMQTVGIKETHVDWSTVIGKSESNELQTPELLLLIVELFVEYEPKQLQTADICHTLLKALGEKLTGDGVVFERGTADFVLFSMRCYPWWIRYAISTWFSHTLAAPKQQLPTGLYKCMTLDQQEKSEQISVDFPFSPAECFFRSFFELALFDVELAADFLRNGISVRPRDENVVEKMAMALVDTCERMHYRERITALAPLLSELLRTFDPSQEIRLIESLCESTFHGLRLIQHLLLLAAATKLAYFKKSASPVDVKQVPESDGHERACVADDLLQAFCELTKSHAEKEVVNLRRSKLPFPPEIKEDLLPPSQVAIRRDERVYSQLSALFNVACSITRLVSQPPFALQVLINCLAEFLYEVQNMRIGTFLDDLASDHYKGNTVYAVAQPVASKKQPTNRAEVDSTMRKKPAQLRNDGKTSSGNRTCCAENELFGTVGGPLMAVDPLATARQISGATMRQNVEKRLVNRQMENLSQSEDSRDGSGRNGKKRRGVKRR